MAFNIEFLVNNVTNTVNEKAMQFLSARLTCGSDTENIEIPITSWDKDKYQEQWLECINILFQSGRSAFITGMPSIDKPLFALEYWPIYLQNDDVYMYNKYEVLDRSYVPPFDTKKFYESIPARSTLANEGDYVSEWRCKREEIQDFKNRLDS